MPSIFEPTEFHGLLYSISYIPTCCIICSWYIHTHNSPISPQLDLAPHSMQKVEYLPAPNYIRCAKLRCVNRLAKTPLQYSLWLQVLRNRDWLCLGVLLNWPALVTVKFCNEPISNNILGEFWLHRLAIVADLVLFPTWHEYDSLFCNNNFPDSEKDRVPISGELFNGALYSVGGFYFEEVVVYQFGDIAL